ncbi:MAG TPA: FAD-binding protein [Galbitalea sp.]
MAELSRRHVLVLAAVGLVAAGCAPVTPVHSGAPTPAGPPDWAELAGNLRGALARPGDSSYDTAKLTENPRWDAAMPLAVVSVASASDVATALQFAKKYGLPLALRSGGHSYPGYSAGGAHGIGVPPSLVIDTRGLNEITLTGTSVNVGAGASLAEVYSAVGSKGQAIAGGSCATVGVAGLTLGGGVGVLVRAYGLTIDSLTSVDIVTADGVARTASATTNPDLFWACRGGGGGHLGIVTALTFDTVSAPTVTMFSLSWPFASADSVIKAWQAWAPTANDQLWSTLKLLNGPKYGANPGVFVSGTWLGAAADLNAQFAPFFAAAGTPASDLRGTHTYLDAMMRYAGCATTPIAQCTTGPGGALVRESFTATSHIANAPLSDAGIQQIISKVVAAGSVAGVREAGISLDALGGAVRKVDPTATAYPHRNALASIQYTATFPDGTDPAPLDSFVRGFRAAMVPHWGDGAYVNYADATLADPAASYFQGNAARLRTVRNKWDPHRVFTQPQDY